MKTNTVSVFNTDTKFYRNENNDVFLKCTCGGEELIMKNTPVATDELVRQMRAAIANHDHLVRQMAA